MTTHFQDDTGQVLDFDPNLCSCGSGHYKQAEHDARGIFLTFVCDDCRDDRLAGYRPDVLTDPGYWHDEPLDAED